MTGATPAARIEALRAANPGAVELAMAVSLAARVEPKLLRDARLLVGADAAAEADLWWSDLVASQNADGIVLDATVADELRSRLAEPDNRSLRERAWELVRRRHATEHRAVRLEELVNWLSISSELDAADRIEELLVAGAREWMVSATNPAGGVRWMLSALHRLPRSARETPVASVLSAGAAAHVDARLPSPDDPTLPADSLDNWFPWLLSRVPRTTISVRLGDGTLDFETPGEFAHALSVPDTEPFAVDVAWHDGGPRRVEARVLRGEPLRVPVTSDTVTLTTLGGARHVLRRLGRPRVEAGFDFTAVRVAHRVTTGLQGVVSRLLDVVSSFTGWVALDGPAGSGKTTALCAALDELEQDPDIVVLQHFYGRGRSEQDEPAAVIGSLAAQLRAALPDLPPPQESGSVPAWLRAVGGLSSVVVALDGVPGSSYEEVRSWLRDAGFPSLPPERTCFVLSSEFAMGVRDWLEDGDPFQRVSVDPSAMQAACWSYAGAMRDRLTVAFRPAEPPLDAMVAMAEGAIGTFRPLVEWLVSLPEGSASLETVPAAFTPARHGLWSSLAVEVGPSATLMLSLVAVANEGFTVADLVWVSETYAGRQDVARFLRWMDDRHLLANRAEALAGLDGDESGAQLAEAFGPVVVALAHVAVRASIAKHFGNPDLGAWHRLLSEVGAVPGRLVAPTYFARNAMSHAVASGDREAVELRCDASSVLRAVHRLGPEAVAQDLALARTVIDNRDLEAMQAAALAIRDRAGTGLELARAFAHELAIRLGPEGASYHGDPHEALRPLLELTGVRAVESGRVWDEGVALAGTIHEWVLLRRDGTIVTTFRKEPEDHPTGIDSSAVARLLVLPGERVAVLAHGRLGTLDGDRLSWLPLPPAAPEPAWAQVVGGGLLASGHDGRMVHWPAPAGEGRMLLGHSRAVTCAAGGPTDLAARVARAALVELVTGDARTHGIFVDDGLVLTSGAAATSGNITARWNGKEYATTLAYGNRGLAFLRVPVSGHPRAVVGHDVRAERDIPGYAVSGYTGAGVVLTPVVPRYQGLGAQSARRRAAESGISRFVFDRWGRVCAVVQDAQPAGELDAAPLWARDVSAFMATMRVDSAVGLVARAGSWFLTGSEDGTVAVWAAGRDAPVLRYTGHRGPVRVVGVVGPYACSGADDGTLRLWSLDDGHDVAVFAPGGPVTAALPLDGDRVAWGTASGGVGIWHPAEPAASQSFSGHTGRVLGISQYEGRLVSWADDGSVAYWEPGRNDPAWRVEGPPPARSVLWSRGLEVLVLWGDDRVQQYTMAPGLRATECVAITEMGEAVAVGVQGGLAVFQTSAGAERRPRLEPLAAPPTDCILVYPGLADGLLPVAITEQDVQSTCLATHDDFSAEGRSDGRVELKSHTANLQRVVQVLGGSAQPVLDVAFGSSGLELGCGRLDGAVEVWDVKTGELRCSANQQGPATHVALVRDRVAAVRGQSISLFDAGTGRPMGELTGHRSTISGLACVSLDGVPEGPDELLVSCDREGNVKLWDPGAGECIETFRVPATVRALAADGRSIAALDGRDRVWTWQLARIRRLHPALVEADAATGVVVELDDTTETVRLEALIQFPFDVEVVAIDVPKPGKILRLALDQPNGFWNEFDEPGHLAVRPLVAAGRPVELRMEQRDGSFAQFTALDVAVMTGGSAAARTIRFSLRQDASA